MATRVRSRFWSRLFIVAALVIVPWAAIVARAERSPRFAPPAAWVEPHTGLSIPPLPTNGQASYGRRYLLVESQVHVPSATAYHHNVYQILNAEGLADSAQVRLSFDPDYETLVIHHVRLHRGAEVIDKLAPERIQTIQQERDLDRLLYNGELTSLLTSSTSPSPGSATIPSSAPITSTPSASVGACRWRGSSSASSPAPRPRCAIGSSAPPPPRRW